MNSSLHISQQLSDSLSPLIRKGEDVVVIHSALSQLGYERDEIYLGGLLKFLDQLIDEGKTILLPSFTFSFPSRQRYTFSDCSETGIFADLARIHLGFRRTPNPMFSFSVKGPKEDEFLNTRSDSGYGPGTAVERLGSSDVVTIILGASWNSCTVIHAVEERMMVPYREFAIWNYPADLGDGSIIYPFQLYVRKKTEKTTLRFDKIRAALFRKGVLRTTCLNNIAVEAANNNEIVELAKHLIINDPYYFVEKENPTNA
ncbi:aminoglycoside 3-N-acetyltransferase [Paenibacillus sp. DS2363]|uniref:AAC(3) family N-acetyltransferase n=1 Tax=Paenibacillus TaxID=44249 RepID=UPI00209CE491|nr:AAC(3) family N-acetyltransferase [Paenibacillus xylanexedens]MCP1427467.1 aminoglycoside 3-N-acetyltransferase [Paenibacillus xylanexedens]